MTTTTVRGSKTTSTTTAGPVSPTGSSSPTTTTAIEKFDQTSDDELPRLEAYFKIWSKAVDTQMHFNEMSVKSRQLGLTFVVAALGLAGVLLGQDKEAKYSFTIAGVEIHAVVLIILSAALALVMVRTLDLGVYHRMLRGAVAFGEDFEEAKLRASLGTEKGMTQAISFFSRHIDAKFRPAVAGTPKYATERKFYFFQPSSWRRQLKFWDQTGAKERFKSAEDKIRRFYFWTIVALLITAAVLFLATYKQQKNKTDDCKKDAATGTPSASVAPPPPTPSAQPTLTPTTPTTTTSTLPKPPKPPNPPRLRATQAPCACACTCAAASASAVPRSSSATPSAGTNGSASQ